MRLHQRLGHVSLERLTIMCRADRTDGIGAIEMPQPEWDRAKQLVRECVACKQGKMRRPTLTGERGLDRGTQPGEVLHMDTAFVKVPVADAPGGKSTEYWLVVVDPYSESRFTAHTNKKSDVTRLAIDIIKQCQQMTGRAARVVHSDNGTEFVNSEMRKFLSNNGTMLSTLPPGRSELNGIAERNVWSFKDGVRVQLQHAKATPHLWPYAASNMAYIWNRTRIARATGRTPSLAPATSRKD